MNYRNSGKKNSLYVIIIFFSFIIMNQIIFLQKKKKKPNRIPKSLNLWSNFFCLPQNAKLILIIIEFSSEGPALNFFFWSFLIILLNRSNVPKMCVFFSFFLSKYENKAALKKKIKCIGQCKMKTIVLSQSHTQSRTKQTFC